MKTLDAADWNAGTKASHSVVEAIETNRRRRMSAPTSADIDTRTHPCDLVSPTVSVR